MKRFSIILFSSIAIFAVLFVGSAFTKDAEKKQITYEYFQYNASVYGETDFETAGNWISIGTSNPGSNPCTAGTAHSCVVRVDQSLLSTNPLLTLPEKMAQYLQNQGSAASYVNSGSNYTYQKP